MDTKKIVVIAGPSGSGKNTIIEQIKERYPHTQSLVTVTTRAPRPGEIDGSDYFFYTMERFDDETAQGNIQGKRFVLLGDGVHYGVYLPQLRRQMESASVLFAPVDIEGARYLKEAYGALTIFIMPESFDSYRSRIHARSPEMSQHEFDLRMKIAETEFRVHAPQYDYRVVSGDGGLTETIDQILEIIRKEGYTL